MDWLKKLIAAIKEIAPEDADLSAIEKLVEEGVKSEIKTATEGLETKKAELLKEKKEIQAKLKLFDGIDKEEYDKQKKALEELAERELIEVGDLDAVKKAIQGKHEKELKAKQDEIDELTASLHTLLVDQGLTDAFQKNGIAERYLPACRALLRDGVQITKNDSGDYKATAGDVPLEDYVAKWAKSDDGKIYVAAKDNSGGGSGGSGDGDGDGSAGENETRYKELLGKLEKGEATGKELKELSKLGEAIKTERNKESEESDSDDSETEE